jgi:hypothetical protein
VRPLLAWCGLGRLDECFGGVSRGLFTFSGWLNVSECPLQLQQPVSHLVGQSSAHHARPVQCVSYAEVMVGSGPYVEQRLDTRGVLGGLFTRQVCRSRSETHVSYTILECWKRK